MATKNYKRQNLVEGSSMVQASEEIIDNALASPAVPMASVTPFSSQSTDGERLINVQTRVPNSWYKQIRDMKYDHPEFGNSVGAIVYQAIKEFLDNHPIQQR